MKLKVLRRVAQVLSILLLIAIPVLNSKGIATLAGSLYSLAVGPIWITDPLSGFQVLIAGLKADGTLLLSMALPIAFCFVFGRVFCSWMCPQNTLAEFFDYVSRKVKAKHLFRMAPMPWPRYGMLASCLAITIVLGFPVANLISAPGIISVQISEYVLAGAVGYETGLIAAIIVGEVFLLRRAWCNFVCPVGGFLGLFRVRKTLKVAHRAEEGQACTRCGACVKACQLGLNPMGGRIYPLCHNCGDCIAACEKIREKGKPLSFRF